MNININLFRIDFAALEKPAAQSAGDNSSRMQSGFVAELNLMAATKSKNTNAFSQALSYLNYGMFFHSSSTFCAHSLMVNRVKYPMYVGRNKLGGVLSALLCDVYLESGGFHVTQRVRSSGGDLSAPSAKGTYQQG